MYVGSEPIDDDDELLDEFYDLNNLTEDIEGAMNMREYPQETIAAGPLGFQPGTVAPNLRDALHKNSEDLLTYKKQLEMDIAVKQDQLRDVNASIEMLAAAIGQFDKLVTANKSIAGSSLSK